MTTHKIERQKRNGIEFIDRGGQLVYDLYMVSPTHELIGEVRTAPDPRIKELKERYNHVRAVLRVAEKEYQHQIKELKSQIEADCLENARRLEAFADRLRVIQETK
jgi:hypothetical protein